MPATITHGRLSGASERRAGRTRREGGSSARQWDVEDVALGGLPRGGRGAHRREIDEGDEAQARRGSDGWQRVHHGTTAARPAVDGAGAAFVVASLVVVTLALRIALTLAGATSVAAGGALGTAIGDLVGFHAVILRAR